MALAISHFLAQYKARTSEVMRMMTTAIELAIGYPYANMRWWCRGGVIDGGMSTAERVRLAEGGMNLWG